MKLMRFCGRETESHATSKSVYVLDCKAGIVASTGTQAGIEFQASLSRVEKQTKLDNKVVYIRKGRT